MLPYSPIDRDGAQHSKRPLSGSRFRLPQKPKEFVSITELASSATSSPAVAALAEVRTVFGVGEVIERRRDGITKVLIGSSGVVMYLQPGASSQQFTTDQEKLKSRSSGKRQPKAKQVEIEGTRYIVHYVSETDTLQGLCLRYSTSLKTLKRHNDFAGKDFLVCDTLKIPYKTQPNADDAQVEPAKEEPVLKNNGTGDLRFKHRMQLAVVRGVQLASQLKLDSKDAKTYLEMNDWKVADAIEAASSDLKWEIGEQQRKEQHAQKIARFEQEEQNASRQYASKGEAGLPYTYRRVGGNNSVEEQVEMGILNCVPISMRLHRIFTGFSFFR